jgi:hypothetical protein
LRLNLLSRFWTHAHRTVQFADIPLSILKHLDDGELSQHRCLRRLDPVFGDSWTFTDNGVERAIRLGETVQVNVALAMAQAAGAGMGRTWGRPRPSRRADWYACWPSIACTSEVSMRYTRRGAFSMPR